MSTRRVFILTSLACWSFLAMTLKQSLAAGEIRLLPRCRQTPLFDSLALLTPTLPRNLVIRTAAQDVLQIYRDKPWEMFTGKPLEVFDPLVAKYPKDAEVYEWRGYFRSEVRFNREPNLQGAKDDFAQAIRLNSSKPDNYIGRAIANFDLGQLVLAEADYTQALRFGAKALDLPERSSYQAWVVLLSRAETRWLLGNAKGAAQDYTLALKDKTGWEKLGSSADLWRLFWKRGVCHFASGDLKSALNDLDRAIAMIQTEEIASWLAAIPFEYEELYLERGYLRVALGDDLGALADFHQTLELINKPMMVRGESQQISRALDLGSGRDGTHWLYSLDLTLAQAQAALEQTNDAVASLKRADESFAVRLAAIDTNDLGQSAPARKFYEESIKLYRERRLQIESSLRQLEDLA